MLCYVSLPEGKAVENQLRCVSKNSSKVNSRDRAKGFIEPIDELLPRFSTNPKLESPKSLPIPLAIIGGAYFVIHNLNIAWLSFVIPKSVPFRYRTPQKDGTCSIYHDI